MGEKKLKVINRPLVTAATRLELELDEVLDQTERSEIDQEYQALIQTYDLYITPEKLSNDEEWVDKDDFGAVVIDRYEQNGKIGLHATDFICALPPIYDDIAQANANLLILTLNGKQGLVEVDETEMKWLVEPEYDSIRTIDLQNDIFFILQKDNRYRYRKHDRMSEWLDEIHIPVVGWVHVRKGDVWGWLDENIDFTTQHDLAHEFRLPFHEDIFYSYVDHMPISREMMDKMDSRSSAIESLPDEEREVATQELLKFSAHFYFDCEFTPFEKEGKWGLKDCLNGVIVQPEWDELRKLNVMNYFGRKGDKWGVALSDDRVVDNPAVIFDDILDTGVGFDWFKVIYDGKQGVYNIDTNKWVLCPSYDDIIWTPNYGGYVLVRDGKKGFFKEDQIIPTVYEDIWFPRQIGFVRFKKDGHWGYIDLESQWTARISHADLYMASMDYFSVF